MRRLGTARIPRCIVHRLLALAALLLAAGPLLRCSSDPTTEAVSLAFDQLVETLRARDSAALWELTSKSTRAFCDELHAELAEAERSVELYFPEWQQEVLIEQLALNRLGGAQNGRDLFIKLLDFGQLREGDAVDAGLAHAEPQILNRRAIVKTVAGEAFSFVLEEDGVWRTDIYDSLRAFPLVQTLRENAATLKENVRRLRELYATASDPKSPEGAFNQFRDSIASANGNVIHTLLDEAGRKVLGDLRAALAGLASRPASERNAALASASLDGLDLAAVTSAPALASALAKRGTLAELAQLQSDSAIFVVRLHSRSEATILTTEAAELDFVREADGLWHLTGAGEALRSALLDPLSKKR